MAVLFGCPSVLSRPGSSSVLLLAVIFEETLTRGNFDLFLNEGNFPWGPLSTPDPHPGSLQPQHTLGHVLSISQANICHPFVLPHFLVLPDVIPPTWTNSPLTVTHALPSLQNSQALFLLENLLG